MLLLLSHLAQAAPACVADDICDPLASPCLVDTDWEIGDGCTLDFGAREVRVLPNGRLDAGTGSVEIYAHALMVDSGELRGRDGGAMSVWLGDEFILDGLADFHTGLSPGRLEVHASFIWVLDRITLYSSDVDADGGTLWLDSASSLVVDASIDASGGRESSGGSVTLLAQGTIDVAAAIDASGGSFDGGTVEIHARGPLRVAGTSVSVNGGGDAGSGGTVLLTGGGLVDVDTSLRANGGDGGWGGTVVVRSRRSSVMLGGAIQARGGGVDGDGGAVKLVAREDVYLSSAVDADGTGADAAGGEVLVSGGRSVSLRRPISANGGSYGGGSVAVYGRGEVEILDDIAAHASGDGDGGEIVIKGYELWMDRATLNVQGGPTGSGGSNLLEACELDLSATAVVDANDDGGSNEIVAHGSMQIAGDVIAGGSNTFVWRGVAPVVDAGARIIPTATSIEDPALAVCPV